MKYSLQKITKEQLRTTLEGFMKKYSKIKPDSFIYFYLEDEYTRDAKIYSSKSFDINCFFAIGREHDLAPEWFECEDEWGLYSIDIEKLLNKLWKFVEKNYQ